MKNRIFLVVTVLATIAYLTLMTAKATTVTPEVVAVEAAVVTEAPVITEVPVIEPLIAETETASIPVETHVAGFSLLSSSDLEAIYAEKDNDDDLMLLARLVESKAGNQSMAGKLAVASVVWNRTQYWNHKLFGTTIKEVILQDGSFDGVGT
jgi:hypothetical protein